MPARGRKVSLEFVGGFLPGGFTENVYTDSNGVARVPHASTGRVKVYVDGNHSSHRTTGRPPHRSLLPRPPTSRRHWHRRQAWPTAQGQAA